MSQELYINILILSLFFLIPHLLLLARIFLVFLGMWGKCHYGFSTFSVLI